MARFGACRAVVRGWRLRDCGLNMYELHIFAGDWGPRGFRPTAADTAVISAV
jgi:hypothetical protein